MSIMLLEYVEKFPIHLHCLQPEDPGKLWVFYSQYEVSQTDSSPGKLLASMINI